MLLWKLHAVQSQFFDCSTQLSKQRDGVNDYFPIYDFFPLTGNSHSAAILPLVVEEICYTDTIANRIASSVLDNVSTD